MCFLSPLRGLVLTRFLPTPYGVGCVVSPPRGCCPVANFVCHCPTCHCQKTSGVITPTAGARSRAIRVCCLHPGFRMSLAVPHSRGEVAGVASFLGLRVVASGPYIRQIARTEILSKGCSSQLENNVLWKTLGGMLAASIPVGAGKARACGGSRLTARIALTLESITNLA